MYKRQYNGSDKVIKLERKKKYGSWIYKEDAPLTRDEFERILAGDYDLDVYKRQAVGSVARGAALGA